MYDTISSNVVSPLSSSKRQMLKPWSQSQHQVIWKTKDLSAYMNTLIVLSLDVLNKKRVRTWCSRDPVSFLVRGSCRVDVGVVATLVDCCHNWWVPWKMMMMVMSSHRIYSKSNDKNPNQYLIPLNFVSFDFRLGGRKLDTANFKHLSVRKGAKIKGGELLNFWVE